MLVRSIVTSSEGPERLETIDDWSAFQETRTNYKMLGKLGFRLPSSFLTAISGSFRTLRINPEQRQYVPTTPQS